MIDARYVFEMGKYNQWQNRVLIEAADELDDAAREADRGAFFGSIRKTMSHILWADLMWLHRFTNSAKPDAHFSESADYVKNWNDPKIQRPEVDRQILDWSQTVDSAWLDGELNWYSGLSGATIEKPVAVTVIHSFNHQTHHRGQVHALLTAARANTRPTDFVFMPSGA